MALNLHSLNNDKVVLELDESGIQTGRNVYGTNLLMRNSEGTSYYYMYNGHADVTALLKPDGTVAATYYYDAFGNITETTGTTSNTIIYAGYQYDKETGLYYLNARMYDPKTARFLQEDTYTGDINDPLSLNLYTYCHNEPLMYYDPTGHWPEWLDKLKTKALQGLDYVGDKISDGASYVASKTSDAWDATKSVASSFWESAKSGVSSFVDSAKSTTVGAWNDTKKYAKLGKELVKKEIAETTEGFKALTNPKKTEEAFNIIDTYGSTSDKVVARIAAGTVVVAGTTAVVATAVYVAPYVATVAYSAYGVASTTAVGNYLWNNPDVGLDVYKLVSDVYNNNGGNIPMDMLAFAYNGANYGANYRTGRATNNNIEPTQRQINYNAIMANRNSGTGASEVSSAAKWSSEKGIYEVGYEVRLQKGVDYPNVVDTKHFQQANKQLYDAFQADPKFAKAMEEVYPGINQGVMPGKRGAFPNGAPTRDVTWHHNPYEEGLLQLVRRDQHRAGGFTQSIFHPEGKGGMEVWGGGR